VGVVYFFSRLEVKSLWLCGSEALKTIDYLRFQVSHRPKHCGSLCGSVAHSVAHWASFSSDPHSQDGRGDDHGSPHDDPPPQTKAAPRKTEMLLSHPNYSQAYGSRGHSHGAWTT
jgi:hypothetical protein